MTLNALPTPAAYTTEEVRDMYLNHMRVLVNYWHNESRCETERERMEGLVFSILVMLDGGSASLPSVDLCLSPHPTDKEYLTSIGEKHFEAGMIINNCQLHELWFKKK